MQMFGFIQPNIFYYCWGLFLLYSVGDRPTIFLKVVLNVVLELNPAAKAIPRIFNSLILEELSSFLASSIL